MSSFGLQQRFEFSFKPQGPVADAYVRDRSQRAFVMGPLGSGKTNASCWKAFRCMCDQKPDREGNRKTRLVAIRNTYSDLLSTTAKDWLEMFEPLGRFVAGGREPPEHRLDFMLPPERPGDKPTRVLSELVFLALDREEHVRKLRGLQLTAGMLSEAKELPFAVLQMLDLRIGRYPQGEIEPTWYGIFGDTNAPDTDHWYYRMAEEKRPEGWAFYRQPGGLTRDSKDAPWRTNQDAENLRNLPRDYYIKGAQGKDEDWILVNLANEYGFVADGKPVYPDYRDSAMCRPFELVREVGIHVGVDFGLTPAALIGQQTLSGQWRYRHELVTEDTGILRFGDELNLFMQRHYLGWPILGIYGDPAGGQRQAGDVDERTVFQLLASKGIKATPAPGNNDFVLRAEAFSAPMKRFIDGEPGMLIHPDCRVTRKGLQGGYAYKRIKVANSDRWRDLPDKNQFSHPCFVAGTLIDTPSGQRRIEALRVGDVVCTPLGPRPIRFTMNRPAEVFTMTMTNGTRVTCTPDHPIYTQDGFVAAEALRYRHLIAGRGVLWKLLFRLRRTTALRSGRSTSSAARASTGAAGTTSPWLACTYTKPCGWPTRARSLWTGTSTMLTSIRPTTIRTIWSAFHPAITALCTRLTQFGLPSPPLLNGGAITQPRRPTLRDSAPGHYSSTWPSADGTASYALGATGHSRAWPTSPSEGSAACRAKAWPVKRPEWMTKTAAAWFALLTFARTSTRLARPVRVLAVGSRWSAVVFNIEVDDAHCYYANGLFVKNCEAGQYLVLGAGEGANVLGSPSADRDRDVAGFRELMGYATP